MQAKQWNIPVLPLSWLKGSVHAGALLPLEASSSLSHRPILEIACALPSGPSLMGAHHSDRAATSVRSSLTLPISSSPPPQSAYASDSTQVISAAPIAAQTLDNYCQKNERCASLGAAAGDSTVSHPTSSADANSDHSSKRGKGHIRDPPVAVIAEPEKRRAAVLQPAAFGTDILQDVHSPG